MASGPHTELTWLNSRPAGYSLNWVQHTTTVAKWLAGLNGAAVVLAFAYYIQAYLSILSIKNDCASRLFVADAMNGAVQFIGLAVIAGIMALTAIAWPAAVVGARRNSARRRSLQLPLRPGQEFDGLSEAQVYRRAWFPQFLLCFSSAVLLSLLVWFLTIHVGVTIAKPEGLQDWWRAFEVKCPKQPPDLT